jgi:uncharacterized protein YbjT (DUF2867 family)
LARIAILGATGKLGERLISEALEQGHTVNALARDPRKIKKQNENLSVIMGDAETGKGLDAVVEHCQFVVCALGSLFPVMEKCVTQLVPHLESLKPLKRFVLVSRLGAGESAQQATKVSGPIQSRLPVLLMPVFRDLNLAEKAVRDSTLPYTIVHATRLTDDPLPETVSMVGPNDLPPHRIGRAALAHFVVGMLDWTEYHRKEMTVGSK